MISFTEVGVEVAERVTDYVHPLIAALRGDPAGEPAFWERIAEARTPLVEPDPAHPGYSLVTYVFPAGEARHVVVQPGFGVGRENVMERVPGAGVCHATYRYRNDVRTSYSFGPDMPLISFLDADEAEWKAFRDAILNLKPEPDPNGRESWVSRAGDGLPDNVTSMLTLPEALDQALAQKRAGVARGHLETHQLRSEIMGNERRVWVYTPPGYDAARRYPLLLAFDGGAALTLMPTHRILDNLIADGRIEPLVAVMLDNATPTSRNVELPCNEDFVRFLETELLPLIEAGYSVSKDPNDRFVTGVSYGGLASFWVGLRLPHLFGNVIGQSSSLWWGPGFDLDKPLNAQTNRSEWLIDQYAATPRLPLKIWMEVGLMEPSDRMIEPNRRMREALQAKGYDVTYAERPGGHDYALWRGTLALALTDMMGAAAPAKEPA